MLSSSATRWLTLVCLAVVVAASAQVAEAAGPASPLATVKIRSPQSLATFGPSAPLPWHRSLSAVHPALLALGQLLASLAVLIWFESQAAEPRPAARVRRDSRLA